jgi:citrate synthase
MVCTFTFSGVVGVCICRLLTLFLIETGVREIVEKLIDMYIEELGRAAKERLRIDEKLYDKHDVKRGLRCPDGKGVLVGLTQISDVAWCGEKEGINSVSATRLLYRGYDISDIVRGLFEDDRFGFEEVCYLLILGDLPTKEELREFNHHLSEFKHLPDDFPRDMIINTKGRDIMNVMARSVLYLYSHDENPDDISVSNVLRQSMQLIGNLPAIAAYSYNAFAHYCKKDSLVIHNPDKQLGIAENILRMIRSDSGFTRLEAKLLDVVLILNAENGGSNNSSFTSRVVTSSGTDTYSSVSSAICSLKGPNHGGASKKVVMMMDDIKENVSDWNDIDEIEAYLSRITGKEAFDRTGIIYGMGHDVRSASDPRSEILKPYVRMLAQDKGLEDEFDLYERVERLAPIAIGKSHEGCGHLSADVDYYSGFVYRMLDIPPELYTPLLAVSRIAGWSAHRLEELANDCSVINPSYKCVSGERSYGAINMR